MTADQELSRESTRTSTNLCEIHTFAKKKIARTMKQEVRLLDSPPDIRLSPKF